MDEGRFQSFKGHYLLAMPSLGDSNFGRSVVFLCDHRPDGAMGFVLTRHHDFLEAAEVFQEFDLEMAGVAAKTPVYDGGPVHQDEIFLLHGPPFGADGTYPLNEKVALSNSMKTLAMVGKGLGPLKVAIFLGSAGWGPGQLEAELSANAWLTLESSEDLIFEVPTQERWETALHRLGVDPLLLSNDFGRA